MWLVFLGHQGKGGHSHIPAETRRDERQHTHMSLHSCVSRRCCLWSVPSRPSLHPRPSCGPLSTLLCHLPSPPYPSHHGVHVSDSPSHFGVHGHQQKVTLYRPTLDCVGSCRWSPLQHTPCWHCPPVSGSPGGSRLCHKHNFVSHTLAAVHGFYDVYEKIWFTYNCDRIPFPKSNQQSNCQKYSLVQKG